jgi:hypothetical protein
MFSPEKNFTFGETAAEAASSKAGVASEVFPEQEQA